MSWLTRLFMSEADLRMEAENEVLEEFTLMLEKGDKFDAYRYLLRNTVGGQTSRLLQTYRQIAAEQLAKEKLRLVE